MLTVLHTESSTGWGGQENRTLMECRGLRDLGQRALILCQPGAELGRRAEAEGFAVHRVRMRRSYDLAAIARIAGLIGREKIDIVNTHSSRDSLLCGVAARLAWRRPRIVRTRHLALPITTRISYSLLPHRVVTVSRYVRDYLVSRGVPAQKVVAIPTGIDLAVFDPSAVAGGLREELAIAPGAPLIGTVAILRHKKGHAVLLDAAPRVLAEFPDAVFAFAGDGPQRENLERRVDELGMRNSVRFLGLRRDIPAVLKSLDLFVLPTFEEALGTSYVEAMAMEKPVIGTAVGGVGEVVRDGINGALVEARNPAALAEAMLRLLRDREGMAAMGRRGRKLAEEEFSAQAMSRAMLELYASLSSTRRER